MASGDTTYVAQGLVNVAEGQMYGPGSVIEGEFNPDDDHNASLIEAGLISASTADDSASTGDSGESPASAAGDGSGDDSASDDATPAAGTAPRRKAADKKG